MVILLIPACVVFIAMLRDYKDIVSAKEYGLTQAVLHYGGLAVILVAVFGDICRLALPQMRRLPRQGVQPDQLLALRNPVPVIGIRLR
jgi:hypothetical protein